MEHSPPWGTDCCSPSQEIAHLLVDVEVRYHYRRNLPFVLWVRLSPCHCTVSIKGNFKYDPIYTYFCQVVSFFQVSPLETCTCLFSLPYMLHAMPISSSIWWPLKIFDDKYVSLELLICSCVSCYSQAHICSLTPYSWTPSASVFLWIWETKFHTQNNGQNYSSEYFILMLWDIRWEVRPLDQMAAGIAW